MLHGSRPSPLLRDLRGCQAPPLEFVGLPGAKVAGMDTAVATYGVQLKAWIDLQVEAYLREVMPSFLSAELGSVRHDCMIAMELAEHVEGEAQAVAEAQAKLLAVVEDMSEELAAIKDAVAACQSGVQLQRSMLAANQQSAATGEEALIQVSKVRELVEELKKAILAYEEQGLRVETVSEALCQQERALKAASERQEASTAELWGELRGLMEEVQLAEQRHAETFNIRELIAEDRRSTVQGLERDLVGLACAADAEARRELEARLEVLRGELGRATASWADQLDVWMRELRVDLEARLAEMQLEASGRVQQESPQPRGPEMCLAGTLEAQLESLLEARLGAALLESRQATRGQVEELRTRIGDDLAVLRERLLKDVRAEMASTKSRESTALAALDEQLWITDQRLGQRIDELVHLQMRERVALAEWHAASRGGKPRGPSQDHDHGYVQATTLSGTERADAEMSGARHRRG